VGDEKRKRRETKREEETKNMESFGRRAERRGDKK
jgi:hypothetical protein